MQQNKNKPRNTYLGNGLYPGVTSRVVRQYGLLGGEVLTAQLILSQNKCPVTLPPPQRLAWTGSPSGESAMVRWPSFWAPWRTKCAVVLGPRARGRGVEMGLLLLSCWESNYRDPGTCPSCCPEFGIPWTFWGEKGLEVRVISMTQDSNCNNLRHEWASATHPHHDSGMFRGLL